MGKNKNVGNNFSYPEIHTGFPYVHIYLFICLSSVS